MFQAIFGIAQAVTGAGRLPREFEVVVLRYSSGLERRQRHVSVQVNVDASGHNIVGDPANGPSIVVDPTNPTRIAIG